MGRRDRGTAVLAAVAAIAVFSTLSLEMLTTERGINAEVAARLERARLEAAAEAATMVAIQGLAVEDRVQRWSIDGRPRTFEFDGVSMTITVEDERGKVPLNRLDEDQARRLFEAAGVTGERLEVLTDSLNDWLDDDDETRPHGAEAAYYAARGRVPDGHFQTIYDLAGLRGMDETLMARLAPYLTTNFGNSGGFSAATSTPFAIRVMSQGGQDGPEAIERERELNGQRTAIEISAEQSLVGRPLTIRVAATDRQGGALKRATLVELTGAASNPYWIRQVD